MSEATRPSGEAGHDREELMGLLLDAMDSAAAAFDRDGRLTYANRAASELGLVREGRLAAPELGAALRAAKGDRRPRQVEAELAPSPGRAAPLALTTRVIPADGGDILVLASDLSEWRRVDAVRQDFVANVSHELKTPVGAIALLAEAVEAGRGDPEALAHFTAKLRREAFRLSRLVQELIDLSRLQDGEAPRQGEEVPATRILREAVERVAPSAAAKRIEVALGAGGRAKVAGDRPQLVTAIANLLDNAVAYSPEGAKVRVRARSARGKVTIEVLDQGIGIAPEHRERIFERFYRIDPARSRATGGTGLGLAIVKHVVANHGGTIRVESEVGRGSVFTVTLPVAGAAPAGRR